MSKYRPLTEYLTSLATSEWRATFEELEQILGFALPASAYEHPAWWSNQSGSHAQSAAWQDAGWRTENLDLESRNISFVRRHSNALAGVYPETTQRQPFLNALATSKSSNSFLSSVTSGQIRPLTIAQAKAGLAAHFGITEDSIEIIIKG